MRHLDRARVARPADGLAADGHLLTLAACTSATAPPSRRPTPGPAPRPRPRSIPSTPPAVTTSTRRPPTSAPSTAASSGTDPSTVRPHLPGAVNTAYLYTQLGLDGELVGTSAFVSVPDGDAPEGGWPVVSWAHGTTGIADDCAPTRYTSYTSGSEGLLASWIEAGYAVVSTDYEGLGTPEEHPYLIGKSEARAVLDAVTAARQVDDSLGNELVVAGHSQGGHAALWAAAIAPTYLSDVDLRGAIALAPPSSLAAQVGLLDTQTSSGATGTVALILRGCPDRGPGHRREHAAQHARREALPPDADDVPVRPRPGPTRSAACR